MDSDVFTVEPDAGVPFTIQPNPESFKRMPICTLNELPFLISLHTHSIEQIKQKVNRRINPVV